MRVISAMQRRRSSIVLTISLACLLLVGCRPTPQLGGNEECFGAADALWTAVTAKDPSLVDASEKAIQQLHTEAKLSDPAFDVLTEVIASTRTGDWDGARGDLKDFVRGQRPATRP